MEEIKFFHPNGANNAGYYGHFVLFLFVFFCFVCCVYSFVVSVHSWKTQSQSMVGRGVCGKLRGDNKQKLNVLLRLVFVFGFGFFFFPLPFFE